MATSISSTGSTNVISALGAGSGLDTKALAQNLQQAEKAPRQALIDSAMSKSQAKISGYGAVMFSLASFKDAFAALQDRSVIGAPIAEVTGSNAFTAKATAAAAPGLQQIEVRSLAQPQRSMSAGFASRTDNTLFGSSGTLSLSAGGGAPVSIGLSGLTLDSLASAINGYAMGITATVVNTGSAPNPFRLVLTSDQAGAASTFTATPSSAGPAFTQTQAAADAHVLVDGLEYWRDSNTITDVIPGVNITLRATTTGGAATSLRVSRDSSSFKASLNTLITSFNDLQITLNVVKDSKSTVPNIGATLVSETLVDKIRRTVTNMITSDASSTVSGDKIRALSDLGVSLQKDGTLKLDTTTLVDTSGNSTSASSGQTRLDYAINNQFGGVVKMLTNDTDQTYLNAVDALSTNDWHPGARGAAGDAVKQLLGLMSRDGPLTQGSKAAQASITALKTQQAALDTEMQGVLDRYTQQFAAMDAIVGKMRALQASLKNQFDAMLNLKN